MGVVVRIAGMKAFVVLVLLASFGGGQRQRSTGEPTTPVPQALFGDFRIEGLPKDETVPQTFHLTLLTRAGQVVARQPISNNGRYRFLNVTNGDYNLVVELDGEEQARIQITLADPKGADVRQDVVLTWTTRKTSKTVASSVATYDRNAANSRTFEQAEGHLKKKQYDKAALLLNEIVKVDPKDYIAWTELGTAYAGKQDSGAAEKAYLRALDEKPTFVVAIANLGKVRMGQRNYEGAVDFLSKAADMDPTSAESRFLLGECYLQLKKGSKAVVYLGEALKLDPMGMAEAHLRLGALYNAAGLRDRAAAEYEQFLVKRPDYPQRDRLKQYISENKRK